VPACGPPSGSPPDPFIEPSHERRTHREQATPVQPSSIVWSSPARGPRADGQPAPQPDDGGHRPRYVRRLVPGRPVRVPRPARPAVVDPPTLPRRRVRGAVRARRQTNRLAFVLGGIVLAFLLAFFSLAQSVRVSATGYDLERLGRERDALLVRKQELTTDLNRLGQEPAVRKMAIDAGLTQLSAPIVVGAN
jgi:hypothetical protein